MYLLYMSQNLTTLWMKYRDKQKDFTSNKENKPTRINIREGQFDKVRGKILKLTSLGLPRFSF